jgi:hypothetical protein
LNRVREYLVALLNRFTFFRSGDEFAFRQLFLERRIRIFQDMLRNIFPIFRVGKIRDIEARWTFWHIES